MARVKKEANSVAASTPRRSKVKKDPSDDEMPKAKATSRGKESTGRGKKAKKDPNAPKRGLSAYMFYANANREKVREDDPDITFGQVGKKLGEQWKALEADEKKKYEDMAAKDKKRYEDEKKKYNASAGDDDDEEGSE